mgnify:CR=1 FL=1
MPETLADQKEQLRQHHHFLRRSLQPNEWRSESRLIIKRLLETEKYQQASSIHTYVSMEKNREVNTTDLIAESLKREKRVVVPRMTDDGKLTHHSINSIQQLKKNRWGVMEPENVREISIDASTLIIVPMLAADFKRNRLGYGKGYYDRFLSQVDSYKIGLCYSFNLSWTPLPSEPFDIKMDTVVTGQFTI